MFQGQLASPLLTFPHLQASVVPPIFMVKCNSGVTAEVAVLLFEQMGCTNVFWQGRHSYWRVSPGSVKKKNEAGRSTPDQAQPILSNNICGK